MLNKEKTQAHLITLKQHPGWKIVEYWIQEQLKPLLQQVETYPPKDIEYKQGEIKGLKFILQKVEQGSK